MITYTRFGMETPDGCLPENVSGIPVGNTADRDGIADTVADTLSDEYGFLVSSFGDVSEPVSGPDGKSTVSVTGIEWDTED